MPYYDISGQPEVTTAQNPNASAVSENVAPAEQTVPAVTLVTEVTPTTTAQAPADEDTASPVQPIPETDTTDSGQTETATPTAQAVPDAGTPSSEQTMYMTDNTTETAIPVAPDEDTSPPAAALPQ